MSFGDDTLDPNNCSKCGANRPWRDVARHCARLDCPLLRNPIDLSETTTFTERPATRVITVTEPGYEVVLFFNSDGGAQAMIKRPGDKLPIGVRIAPPEEGRRIVVERVGDIFEVLYKDDQP